ncbi:MAG: MFS transporter, partial [Gracilimonas sp.]
FSFTLPKTPPKISRDEEVSIREILGLDALSMLKDRNFLIFFIASVLICIPLAFYYQNANPFLAEIGVNNPTGIMTIGQVSEVLFMLLIPFFLTRFGIKKTLLIGMLAWALRYVMFAYGNSGELFFMLIIGIALHGICYDFFFVAGQIYTDSKAGEKFKSSAQGLITLATYGVGMLIGFWAAGKISEYYTVGDLHEWEMIWLIPGAFAFLVFLVYIFAFKDEKIDYEDVEI